MASSLTGEFVYLVVQVTHDMVPVVYSQRVLPVSGFDLYVRTVTYEQFKNLAQGTMKGQSFSTASEWQASLSASFHSLEYALQVSQTYSQTNEADDSFDSGSSCGAWCMS
jgi:hypothetical protein